jgi:hypothetical protein
MFNNFLWLPPAPDSSQDEVVFTSYLLGPLRDCLGLAKRGDVVVVAFIDVLLRVGFPSAIFGEVSLFVVDPSKRVLR